MKKQSFRYFQKEKSENPEVMANTYAIHSMTLMILALLFAWFLNLAKIFIVDQNIINNVTLCSCIVYLIGILFWHYIDLSASYTKYLIQFWSVMIITVISSLLTYHAYLLVFLPILYSVMYQSKHIMVSAYLLIMFNTFFSIFFGYYNGICDANMALLTNRPISTYLDATGAWTYDSLNQNVTKTLLLFYVLPRSVICLIITLICHRISEIIHANFLYAQGMKVLAETDEMTGLYNRNKYLHMISEVYPKEDKIAIIFWDANNLKLINDTIGHEYGDALLVSVAQSIREVADSFDDVYRIGGDEFVMVIRGGDSTRNQKKITAWEEYIKHMDSIQGVPVSASYGYANGIGADITQIIHNADNMMYENKRLYHQIRNHKSV